MIKARHLPLLRRNIAEEFRKDFAKRPQEPLLAPPSFGPAAIFTLAAVAMWPPPPETHPVAIPALYAVVLLLDVVATAAVRLFWRIVGSFFVIRDPRP